MRTVTVSVTADDIRNGIREDCHWCPVARALTRTFGEPWVAQRDSLRQEVETARIVRSPRAVTDFIVNFDYRWPVAPFTFTLDIPWMEPEVAQ